MRNIAAYLMTALGAAFFIFVVSCTVLAEEPSSAYHNSAAVPFLGDGFPVLIASAEEIEEPDPASSLVDINGCSVLISGDLTYTGKKIRPVISVEYNGLPLIPQTDYICSLKNNINAGEASLTVSGMGNYTGTKEVTFMIQRAYIDSVNGLTTGVYSGRRVTQTPVVKSNGRTLSPGSDYSLSYKNNIKVGKASVTVTGTGNYRGKMTGTFTIRPLGTSVTGTDETLKAFTAKWKKQRFEADGYQIRWSSDRYFNSSVRTKKIHDTSVASLTSRKPAGAEKVYIGVRTFKKADGRTYYSTWSRTKATDGFITADKNMRGAAKVGKAVLFARPRLKADKLATLPFASKVRIRKEKNNWYYVTFKKDGQSFKGYMRGAHIVPYNRARKHLALTFDDGPRAGSTDIVLNALEKSKCRATFFVVGNGISDKTRDLILREKNLRCEIGNHSFSHPQLTKLSREEAASQLAATDKAVRSITGKKPALCRAPYGAVNDSVLAVMNRPNILWSVDTLDWKYRDTARLIDYVRANRRDGAVILMHDIHLTTANAVRRICKDLKKSGYETVTVTELAAIKGYSLAPARSYRSFY